MILLLIDQISTFNFVSHMMHEVVLRLYLAPEVRRPNGGTAVVEKG
jgi:hypothetical protein